MISTASVTACMLTLFISLFLPVLVLVVYALRHRKEGVVSAWFLGAAGFFVSQILLRVPLLNLLASTEGFLSFAQSHPILYTLALAFTAGLFELAGRYAVAMAMRRKLSFPRSLAAGLGHGGIEAMLLVGLTYVNNLVYMLLIRSGSFDALVAQTAAAGVDVSQLEAVRDLLVQTSPALYLAAGYERLLTMVCHVALTVLVCYGVHSGHVLRGLLLCLGLHTLLDFSTVLTQLSALGRLSQAAAYGGFYVFLTVMALVCLWILKALRARWN